MLFVCPLYGSDHDLDNILIKVYDMNSAEHWRGKAASNHQRPQR